MKKWLKTMAWAAAAGAVLATVAVSAAGYAVQRATDGRVAPLGDKRLIDYIIAALQGSGRIRRIVVAARPEALALLEGTLPADVLLCKAAGDLPATAVAASDTQINISLP